MPQEGKLNNKTQVICTMKPLRKCLEQQKGDIQQCKEEIRLFEQTCDKRIGYVHDRDGLDDVRPAMYTGKKEI